MSGQLYSLNPLFSGGPYPTVGCIINKLMMMTPEAPFHISPFDMTSIFLSAKQFSSLQDRLLNMGGITILQSLHVTYSTLVGSPRRKVIISGNRNVQIYILTSSILMFNFKNVNENQFFHPTKAKAKVGNVFHA